MLLKLYHTTTPENANKITKDGFIDTRGNYGMIAEDGNPFFVEGVFFSDGAMGNEDGLDTNASAVFRLEIPEELIIDYELIEDYKGYREWCIPSPIVNRYVTQRTPITLDQLREAIHQGTNDDVG